MSSARTAFTAAVLVALLTPGVLAETSTNLCKFFYRQSIPVQNALARDGWRCVPQRATDVCLWPAATFKGRTLGCNRNGQLDYININCLKLAIELGAPLDNDLISYPEIKTLIVVNCGLVNPLPKGLWRLPKLVEMSLMNNELKGPLFNNLGGSGKGLKRLILAGNSFGGPLVSTWTTSFPQLEWVNLDGNENLKGTVPAEWGSALSPWAKAAKTQVNVCGTGVAGPLLSGMSSPTFQLYSERMCGPLPPAMAARANLAGAYPCATWHDARPSQKYTRLPDCLV